MKDTGKTPKKPVLGWREVVSLPGLGVKRIKAKIDSGARTSSLHAFDIELYERDGEPWVRFTVHPAQRSEAVTIECDCPIHEQRSVRSSSGHESVRPVIVAELDLYGRRYPIELTLANRDEMGFRMLLGREALRGRFLIDPDDSFAARRHARKRRARRSVQPPSAPGSPGASGDPT
ncbi:hypothetical protein Mal64_32440 [Pseudobythopirellula maris]|uniref:Retropepsin-like aspartic endopeptidase domain-containing protein n=1 Tax=Pseudobythopirellula maris TaxID=2527991 RepID=A0A5C5ZLJ6_9BACT|nr:ATP-dependent zinc protease [Pseudobythopirellula maris]TWT87701.1 hypothetical protein Mal64_32440 [Pseudobythopirellula maris]